MNTALRRRSFLASTLAGCALCRGASRALAEDVHWAYEGEAGAEHWGEISPSFKTCKLGIEQSPIDLQGGIAAQLAGLDIAWQPMKLRIVNNGHTIQVNADAGSSCGIGGTRYALQQFHFHHPSEHLLAGKPSALECHFVHRAASGDLAVIGVFLAPGNANPGLQPIWSAMPPKAGPELDAGGMIDPTGLLPKERGFFRYVGSLTTPPCTEAIVWTVLRQPIEVSAEQIAQFAALYADNARPVQAQNRRFLLRSS
jgi:carbonic anhydrase